MKQEHKFNGEGLFEIPDLWTWAISSEVCSSVRDGTHDTPKYVDNGIPLVTSKNLKNGYIDFDTAKLISIQDHEQISFRSEVESGDILFAMIGTIGNPIVVNIDKQFSIKNIGLFKKNEAVIQSIFLRYWLLSEPLNKILEVQRFISGTTQKFISLGSLRSIPIPLPPLNEQRRIVSTIEQLTDRSNKARTALADVPKLIAQFRQSVLAAAFRGDLTADWREQNPDIEPASELLERIKIDRRKQWEKAELEKMRSQGKEPKDDKWKAKYKEPNSCDLDLLPVIPDSWAWSSTEELSEVGTGATPKRDESKYYENGSIAWVTSGALNDFFIDKADEYITEIALQETNAKVFPVHTLLIAMYGEGQTRGRVSELLIEAATNQACAALIFRGLNLDVQPIIKLFYQKYYEEIRMLASGGVQPNLNLGMIKSIAIPIPPIEEQKEIFRIVSKCMSILQNLDRENTQVTDALDFLDRSILAKAFRGELVPQDPNDEPAAVLLERIRAERAASSPKQRGKTTRKNSSKQLSIDLE